ncbi:MAG: Copper chaperone CopZ [Candidatus Accumulibacter sp. BA-94]|jgi:copper chaperone|uniref:heavy-metal-associated domain-containing protein n=1 Tax=Accumulibacter sp. TaxID=2053492 RepID=UPI00044F3294|nr:heavy-metal-associated domain-containing protein [Accumulibacter sp.]EXI92033.1 MAG: Copper chaperone CopZ [Candidatus Accumulibacter sp. BA-94]HRD86940.1 heavy-metal-associated domain-containing protein [Accumulibacter sp.]
MEKLLINVSGMSCQGCVRSVTAALTAVAGVAQVEVSLPSGQAAIRCDPSLVSVARLTEAIEAAGFEARPAV